MHHIQVRPVRDLRNHYTEIEAMLDGHDPVIITKNGRGAAVLLNIEDFSDYQDFLHAKYVAEKLKEAETEASEGSDYQEVLGRLRGKYHGL